jgi:hypothetical protein
MMSFIIFTLRQILVIKSRRVRRMGCAARMGEMKNAYMFVEKPEEKRPLEGRRSTLGDDVKTDLKLGCDGMD